jgi:hypothetical protein
LQQTDGRRGALSFCGASGTSRAAILLVGEVQGDGLMAEPTRDVLIAAMKQMDLCFMVTKDGSGLCSRPMSNNAQVDWDGDN